VQRGKPISEEQRRIVLRLLQQTGPAGDSYREQVANVRVLPACTCGCPSFLFEFDDPVPAPHDRTPRPLAEGYATSREGHSLGVILFVRDGRLHELEFYASSGATPFDLPDLDSVWNWGEGPGPAGSGG
jgi:hypothetical protein